MNLLLDTHALLWFIAGDPRLIQSAKELINDSGNSTVVSIASIWEIAIKVGIGKMVLHKPFDDIFPHQLELNGFELLNISVKHASVVSRLPLHHRDPFDRIMAAQAIEENLEIVSADAAFDSYGVTRIW